MGSRLGLPVTQRAMRANLRSILADATPEHFAQGVSWYADAQAFAATLATFTDGDMERASGVIAAHSPRTFWGSNKQAALATVRGLPMPSGTLGSNTMRAERVLTMGWDGLGNGPKVRAFAANVNGDLSQVTVDVWAYRAAMGDVDAPERWLARRGAYDEIARAYAAVATENGLDPAVLQAIIWCAIRGRAV